MHRPIYHYVMMINVKSIRLYHFDVHQLYQCSCTWSVCGNQKSTESPFTRLYILVGASKHHYYNLAITLWLQHTHNQLVRIPLLKLIGTTRFLGVDQTYCFYRVHFRNRSRADRTDHRSLAYLSRYLGGRGGRGHALSMDSSVIGSPRRRRRRRSRFLIIKNVPSRSFRR